jgi:hypothetical protein
MNTWDIFDHSVHIVLIWYIFSGLGIMNEEKSGNPGIHKDKANVHTYV